MYLSKLIAQQVVWTLGLFSLLTGVVQGSAAAADKSIGQLFTEGTRAMRDADFETAVARFRKACALTRQQTPKNPIQIVTCEVYLGSALVASGSYEEAVANMERTISMLGAGAKQEPGARKVLRGTYAVLADSAIKAGDLPTAATKARQGLELDPALNTLQDPITVGLLNAFTYALLSQARPLIVSPALSGAKTSPSPTQLIADLRVLLKFSSDLRGSESDATLDVVLAIAALARLIPDPAQAVTILEANMAAFDRRDRLNGLRLNAHHTYGLALNEVGRTDEAVIHMFDASRKCIRDDGTVDPNNIDALINLAKMLNSLGRAAFSVQLLEAASDPKLGVPSPARAAVLDELGAVYLALGPERSFAEKSKQSLVQARAIVDDLKKAGTGRPDLLVPIYTHLAETLDQLGEKGEAEGLYKIAIDEAKGVRRLTDFAGNGYTIFLYRAGRYDEALPRIQAELDAAVASSDWGTANRARGTFAWALADAGKLDESARQFSLFVDFSEKNRAPLGFSEQERLATFRGSVGAYARYAEVLTRLGRGSEAFEVSELSRGRTLFEKVSVRWGLDSGSVPSADAAVLRSLDRQVDEKNRLIASAYQKPFAKMALERDKSVLIRDYNNMLRTLKSKYPAFRDMVEPARLTVDSARRMLGPDSAYVSYLFTRNGLTVFVLGNQGLLTAKVLEASPNLGNTIEAYRQALSKGGINATGDAGSDSPRYTVRMADGSFKGGEEILDGRVPIYDVEIIRKYLSDQLLSPIAEQLRGKTRWTVSGDGPLVFLPFDTLRLDDEFAVVHHDLSYTQSLSVLGLVRQRDYSKPPRKSLIAIGDALYPGACATTGRKAYRIASDQPASDGSSTASSLSRLRFAKLCWAKTELDQTQRLFDAADDKVVFEGSNASEMKLRSLNADGTLMQYRYILLSAHGYLNSEEPNQSAVVLGATGDNDTDDGFVTVADLAGFRLRSDLVVLSACDTGLGSTVRGEGVIGLTYALVAAGSQSSILTLWPVFDQSTAIFVVRFFEKLKAGASRPQALASTKREFLTSSALSDFRAPLYWAPFVLIGE